MNRLWSDRPSDYDAWSRGRFAGIDPRYGSPRFSPEAPRCRQTAVGIRNAIALFTQDLRSRGRDTGYCQRISRHSQRGTDGKKRRVQRAQKNRAIGPPRRGDIPFRLLQNIRTDNGIPYVAFTTIHLCHTSAVCLARRRLRKNQFGCAKPLESRTIMLNNVAIDVSITSYESFDVSTLYGTLRGEIQIFFLENYFLLHLIFYYWYSFLWKFPLYCSSLFIYIYFLCLSSSNQALSIIDIRHLLIYKFINHFFLFSLLSYTEVLKRIIKQAT